MRHNPIPPVVLAAALSACSLQTELLNSERIQQRFGNYGIEVLQQEDGVRRSNLYSIENGVRICRTYAVVDFVEPIVSELTSAHLSVLAGQSIGTTFRTAGWQIGKETLYVGTLRLPDPQHTIARLMQFDTAPTLGLHAYQLKLHKDAQSIHYATIVESHHPMYLTEAELLQLYGDDISTHLDSADIEKLISLVLDRAHCDESSFVAIEECD